MSSDSNPQVDEFGFPIGSTAGFVPTAPQQPNTGAAAGAAPPAVEGVISMTGLTPEQIAQYIANGYKADYFANTLTPPKTSTKAPFTGSYAFQGNISIDKYGGAIYVTDPTTGERTMVQGPIAPDNLTDASRFSLTSRSGVPVILDNNTGRILPIDQAALDYQAANVAGGVGGPAAPKTL